MKRHYKIRYIIVGGVYIDIVGGVSIGLRSGWSLIMVGVSIENNEHRNRWGLRSGRSQHGNHDRLIIKWVWSMGLPLLAPHSFEPYLRARYKEILWPSLSISDPRKYGITKDNTPFTLNRSSW